MDVGGGADEPDRHLRLIRTSHSVHVHPAPQDLSRKIGTGIGLAVVRDLTRAMGGDVSCEPRAEGGTRFVVRIPAVPGVAPAPHHRPNEG
ncbi:MAG TPA: ATP-binding protein [Acidimicrobiia bacterium]|nr:ATP-binding protein [Acidimicrobiia bacterium]